jgi:hypothetical protein
MLCGEQPHRKLDGWTTKGRNPGEDSAVCRKGGLFCREERESQMSERLSVEEVMALLERRATYHREQEALHAQQEIHHREQRAFHVAELEKVTQSLEGFRASAPTAVDLARELETLTGIGAAAEEMKVPPPGRLMVSQMLRQVAESSSLPEPFNADALAAEANRQFADHLRQPISSRTASDVLRRLLAEGRLVLDRKGKAFTQAQYRRKAGRKKG